MFLKALEIQGFKSFPDKTSLSFGEGITAVVGPNGSGKSNISDAIRWVLGEQSTKSLRGAKMEDVVFGGTSQRKALGFAEVTLRLDNRDRSLSACDRDEVAVTRRYYRSGESDYLMNGEGVRLRDIHELFMDTGLGRDGYSIVSQGRVADMVSARSPQRREMLEEAAGISAFRYRRLDATRRLTQAEDNLSRLRDILAELEGRVGPLKVQSEKAHKFIALAAQKKELEIGLWLHTIEKSKAGLKEQEHRLSVATAQYEAAENDLSRLEREFGELTERGQELAAEIERVRLEAAETDDGAARIDSGVAVEKNTLLHNNSTIERITRDLEQAARDEFHVDQDMERTLKEIAELEEVIARQNEALRAAAADLSGVRDENAAYAGRAEELSRKISELTVRLSEKRVGHSAALSSAEEINQRTENLTAVIEGRSTALTGTLAEKDACLTELEALREKALELQNAVSGYQLRAKNRREKVNELKEKIDRINLDIHQKRTRARMLDDLEKNMEGYAGSVKAVIRESKRGTLRGIHGTVSQLISVDEKYAVAAETAFGAAIQNVVTDSENDAKKAIAFLKETNAGRATFLPITAIRARAFTESGLDGCIGFVAMADALVQYDAQYGEIMRSLLARTAVAEDMDSAVAIARRYGYRFRVVTLDGQVINAGGSMTGGSRANNAGILSRQNEIEKLKKEADGLTADGDAFQQTYKGMTQELAAVEADLSGASADLTREQEAVIRQEGELRLIEGRAESLRNALREFETEKENNRRRVELLTESMKSSGAEIEALSAEADRLRDALGDLAKDREELEARREELTRAESETSMFILSARKDIDAKREAVESYRRVKETNFDKLDALNDEIADIAVRSREIKDKITDMEADAGALRSESAAMREKIASLAAQRAEVESDVTALRQAERGKTQEKEMLGGELARLGERKSVMESELENSRSRLYDEYELTLREAAELGIVIEDPAKSQRTLQEIRNKIRALGNVNVGAIEEYKEVSERFEYMSTQISDIEKSKDELTVMIGDLTGKMAVRFREQFNRINGFFSETFAELFDGGKAELLLENPAEILECAIDIRVQPPGKNVQNIDLLSGGEKGLSAIALLFAILKVSPAPFCVFDEVEAALDEVNVTRYARYVRRMTKNTQFILITHRRGTMEEADILYGVTMQEEGVSKLLELKTAEMAKKLGVG
ncbi:MAG: chromosome segregation protein SMC [Oscillospiraceae bacterium]|nr:chromosome segregation protein SMC [Oscillospiraceae bacterium]